MKAMRNRTLLISVFASTLAPVWACATSDGVAAGPPPPEDSTLSLDGGRDGSAEDELPDVIKGRSTCSIDGFCFVPMAVPPLIAVSAASVDDAWMLPASSNVLFHWDGDSLNQRYEYVGANPPSIVFVGLWAEKKDDVWAVANGSDGRIVVVRYSSPAAGDSPRFRELPTDVPSSTTPALWGTPEGDALWLATESSILRVREESETAVVETFFPTNDADGPAGYRWRGIWGFGMNDIFVAGAACSSDPCASGTTRGVIAHYDGADWSFTFMEETTEVLSLRGTPPGADRRLWYHQLEPIRFRGTLPKTYLVPVDADGALGAPLFTHVKEDAPACTSRIGHASSSGAWLSDGLLVCRWGGSDFESVSMSIDGRPVVGNVNAIWNDGPDDVWVVGAAVAPTGLPAKGFAARRTAKTAKGGQ